MRKQIERGRCGICGEEPLYCYCGSNNERKPWIDPTHCTHGHLLDETGKKSPCGCYLVCKVSMHNQIESSACICPNRDHFDCIEIECGCPHHFKDPIKTSTDIDNRKGAGKQLCNCLVDGKPCAKSCGLDMTGWKCAAELKKDFDPECKKLAKYFLADVANQADWMPDDLASEIQLAVEEWFSQFKSLI